MVKTHADLPGDAGSAVLEQVVAQRERLAERLAKVKRVIAVMSGKGGVGKSALTANLAATMADQGMRVGAIDADVNGATLAQMLGARWQQLRLTPDGVTPAIGAAGVKLMSIDLLLASDGTPVRWRAFDGLAQDSFIWRGTMETTAVREMLADTNWGELDMLILDLPPGVERYSTLARLIPSMTSLAVTIPSAASHLVVGRTLRAAQDISGEILGLVENMSGYVCPNCWEVGTLFSGEHEGQALAKELEIPFLGSIPFDTRLTRACAEGRPIVLTHPGSPASWELRKVADAVIYQSKQSD
jgi:ATP-binding protein involved in chromosome partitioning